MPELNKGIVIFIFAGVMLLVMLLLGLILVMLFLSRKQQQQFALELEKVRTNFEKELFKTELEIQEQTFEYISQEIHDNIGQFISLAKLQLNTLDFGNLRLTKDRVSNSTDLLTKALEDLRDLSRSLNSEIIRSNGLVMAVEQQIAQLRRLGQPEVAYEINGEYQFLDEQKEIFILRILQEAVNNIIRHSDARKVKIQLNYTENNLSLRIADDGKGFDRADPGNGTGSGIGNMSKRANMIGGVFQIRSTIGAGTAVDLVVPY